MSSGVDIDALVARASDRSLLCWFAKQEKGTPTERYMSALESIEKSDPKKVNRVEVFRTLNNELGGKVSLGVVKRHFRGECQCGKFKHHA